MKNFYKNNNFYTKQKFFYIQKNFEKNGRIIYQISKFFGRCFLVEKVRYSGNSYYYRLIFYLVDFINKNINLERISNHENISQSGFESFILYF